MAKKVLFIVEGHNEKEKLLSEEGMKLTKDYDELLVELNRLTGTLEKEKQNLSFMGEEKIRFEGQLNLVLEQYLSANNLYEMGEFERNSNAEEVKEIIQRDFAEVVATKNKGMIMKNVMGALKGKAEGSVINQVVAELCK